VRLRLNGSCHGCPSSQATLRYTIEEAIYAAAPDVAAIQVEGVIAAADDNGHAPAPSPAGFVPLSQVSVSRRSNGPGGQPQV
jgi:hypothetical protein